ncbi:MAG: prepilin peptidase [Candidatus Caldarchaeum sp.]
MEPWSTLITSATLLYASYLDVKTREVDDKVWVIPSAVGATLNLINFFGSGFETFFSYGLAVGITAAVAFGLYFAGLYGGADAKALITICLVQPFATAQPQLHGFNALTVLTNGMLLSASLPISLGLYNFYRLLKGEKIFEGFEAESRLRKIAACFIGVRVRKSAGKMFWSPVEKTENGVRKFYFKISIEEFDGVHQDDMWITPGIPLLVFFTAGYFFNLFAGDLMGRLLFTLAR